MATWGSYLGLGRKSEAPLSTSLRTDDKSEKFMIKPFDPASSYAGKEAEDAFIWPKAEATDSIPPTFIKGSRRTQSDTTPVAQPPQPAMPKRAQSNASRVARLFGYGAPAQEEDSPPEDQLLSEPIASEASTDHSQVKEKFENAGKVSVLVSKKPIAFRDAVRAATQPKMLKIVEEAVEQEAERIFLEYEKKSEQIRMEKVAMDAERQEIFQAQEKIHRAE